MGKNCTILQGWQDRTGHETPKMSFEFFPPKTPEMEDKLWRSITRLAPLCPEFVSVTYGAGGSTRERTHATVKRLLEETDLTPAAHLTCVGSSREEIAKIAQGYWDLGVTHIVALRGDPPAGEDGYTPHPEGYAYADSLVKGLKDIADFDISVAAYPETHPQAPSSEADIEHLKRKFDAGASRAITQYFFDVDCYLRFLDKVRAAGIEADIVPGLVPVANYAQLVRFSTMCGATIPDWVHHLFDGLDDTPQLRDQVSIAMTTEICRQLWAEGVRQFHFYTLNRAQLTLATCRLMGIHPNPSSQE